MMTTTTWDLADSVINEAVKIQKNRVREQKRAKTVKLIKRLLGALLIPLTVGFIIAMPATFIFHVNSGIFAQNVGIFFCRGFFPCIPLMAAYIMRD